MSGWAVQPDGRRGPHTAGNRWPTQGVETRAGTRFGDAKRIVPDNPGRGKVQGSSGRSRRVGMVRLARRKTQEPQSTSLDWLAHRKIRTRRPVPGKKNAQERQSRTNGRWVGAELSANCLVGATLRRTESHERCRAPAKESGQAVPNARCAGPVRQAEDKSRRMTRVSGGRSESRSQQHRPARN